MRFAGLGNKSPIDMPCQRTFQNFDSYKHSYRRSSMGRSWCRVQRVQGVFAMAYTIFSSMIQLKTRQFTSLLGQINCV